MRKFELLPSDFLSHFSFLFAHSGLKNDVHHGQATMTATCLATGDLVFLSRIPREVLVLALLASAAVVWLLYRRVAGRVSRRILYVLIGLRVAFLAVLLAILATPAIQTPRPRGDDVFTAVLVDTSRSMSIPDAPVGGAARPRIDAAKEILQGRGQSKGLLAGLSEESRILIYGFDQEARRIGNPADLKADGSFTNVFQSLRNADAELRGVPLAGVVMLTDGSRNAGGSLDEAAKILKSRSVPLYVVGLGNPIPPKDYEVVKVFAPSRIRRNSEVEAYVTVRNTGYHQPFNVQILRGSTMLVTRTVQPIEGTDLQRVRVTFTPDQDGSTTYKAAIPVASDEAIKTNNSREFKIDIQDDRLPVLYVEGSPRTEYRYLRRVMFRDTDFRLVGLLRLAKDRFYVQGANDGEQYLQKGFPDTPEKLFAFQAVILGDIEAAYFTPQQLQLLEQFVSERGGGVLMLGGVNSFGLGKYAGTPVAKMLPLEISPADPPYSDERYNARITDEGLKHPVMRLSQDVDLNKHLWENAPQLIGITPVRGPRVGGQVLLTSDRGNQPVFAVQNYGQGRVAAFTSGGSWFWQMSVPNSDEFHGKFWKQLIRWLVVGAREQFTIETDAELYARKDPVILRANVFGKDLRPLNDAVVKVKITDPSNNVQELTMDWILSQEGAYQCRYIPQEEGAYSVVARVEGWTSKALTTEFRVSEPLVEFNDAALKEDALKSMAAATGGRYFTADEAMLLPAELAKSIKVARVAGMKPLQKPIWDTPILLAALLVLAALDWIVRRRSGLA